MSRKTDREMCYQMLFSSLFLENDQIDFEERISLICEKPLDDESKKYIKETFEGVLKHRDEIEKIIKNNIKGYEIGGLYKTDLVGLMLAVFELKYSDTPKKVVVNEIVEICKRFSSPKSSQFVNGVLASVLKEMDNE